MKHINIDKEFQGLIPKATDEEIELLEKSLLSEGCRDALITWNGFLIDGHHRYELCITHDIPFNTIAKEFESRDKVIEWIILNQFGRRNISLLQRAELALKLKPIIAEKAKENQIESGGNHAAVLSKKTKASVNTRAELAKVAQVSEGTIRKVEKLLEKAPKEVIEKLRSGETTINKEFKKIEPKKTVEAVSDSDGIIYTFEIGKLPYYIDGFKKRMNLKDGQQFKIILV